VPRRGVLLALALLGGLMSDCGGTCETSFNQWFGQGDFEAWVRAGASAEACKPAVPITPTSDPCPSDADALRFIRICRFGRGRTDAVRFDHLVGAEHRCVYQATGEACTE
jgi:hypothetical protein